LSSFGLFLNPSFLFDNNVQKSQSTSSNNLFANPERSLIPPDQKHLLWVWQFSEDGTKYEIRDKLAKFNLGVVLKTHDGTDWMSEFDPSYDAVSGPEKIHELSQFFESGGVPFHTWSVPHGIHPIEEANMTSLAYEAGSRSIYLDVEHARGFWRGTEQAAYQYGERLRSLHPDLRITTSIDGRPWNIDAIPIDAFALLSDALAPQLYWETFSTWDNIYRYNDHGYYVPSSGISPSFIIQSAYKKLQQYPIAIEPVGEGGARNIVEWSEFIQSSLAHNSETVSAWRYGTTSQNIMKVMSNNEPLPKFYKIQAGDSLYGLSNEWGISLKTILDWNPDITNQNMLSIGQVLRIPDGDHPMKRDVAHTIQRGENLYLIANNWGIDVKEIIAYNQIRNPNQIYVGDVINIPLNQTVNSSVIQRNNMNYTYKIAPGDNLWNLSKMWNVSINRIMEYNNISNANLIRIGTIIKKPN
tara:strand:- start:5782 stop:7188 length:1407 start_codon:yes stop_codon:yes gene_type:complete